MPVGIRWPTGKSHLRRNGLATNGISRVTGGDAATETIASVMMLYSLPREIWRVEALAVFPGQGETWRISQALEWWNRRKGRARHLLLAGGSGLSSVEEYIDHFGEIGRDSWVDVQWPDARNTKEQADWTAEKVRELNIESLALFVSPYHLLRAYCTLLKSLEARGLQIPIVPAPVAISPEVVVPESGANGWQLVAGEVERLRRYQEKGDVATSEELKQYIFWIWRTFYAE